MSCRLGPSLHDAQPTQTANRIVSNLCDAAWQVHLTLGSTLVACVALAQPGSLDAVRLAVFSADEGGGRRASAWGQSQHAVFQCAAPLKFKMKILRDSVLLLPPDEHS